MLEERCIEDEQEENEREKDKMWKNKGIAIPIQARTEAENPRSLTF